MTDLLTTTEAAKVTRHRSRRTFVQWAKRFPGLLRKTPGRRGYSVARGDLEELLGPEDEESRVTLEHNAT